MSFVIQKGPLWPGFQKIKHIVVFGDSYSSVGYLISYRSPAKGAPSSSDPLGVPFPGYEGSMWQESGKPNWVGHLLTKYCGSRNFVPPQGKQGVTPPLVYDFAVGGDTVSGVRRQVEHQFLRNMVLAPSWAPWTSEDTLFVTWVGINDCASNSNFVPLHKTLLELQDELYKAGARNFLFIDVPPIDRSPAVSLFARNRPAELANTAKKYENWNTGLYFAVEEFAKSSRRPGITALYFSSHEIFTKFLDAPNEYGFEDQDKDLIGGKIWNDHLHPTSAVHDIVAEAVAEFLESVLASESEDNKEAA